MTNVFSILSLEVIGGSPGLFFSPLILFIRQTDVFFFSSELKNTRERTNLVGLDEKSSDVCRGAVLVMAERVYHCGIYEWPEVWGGGQKEERGEMDRQELHHF